jgi:hypothetical protein
MEPDDLQKLSAGERVRLTTTVGERLTAKVLFVDERRSELIVDVLSTSMPERYAEMGGLSPKEAYLIPFTYIAGVEPCENKT